MERVAKIEINGIYLRLGMNRGRNEVKISRKIRGFEFRFNEFVLTGI